MSEEELITEIFKTIEDIRALAKEHTFEKYVERVYRPVYKGNLCPSESKDKEAV